MSIEGRLVSPLRRGGTTSQDLGALAGNEYSFVDTQYNTNRECRMKLVCNSSTITLKGTKLVRWQACVHFPTGVQGAGASPFGTCVNGYTIGIASAWAGVTDDLLPSTGCVAASFFLIRVRGPHMYTTSSVAG